MAVARWNVSCRGADKAGKHSLPDPYSLSRGTHGQTWAIYSTNMIGRVEFTSDAMESDSRIIGSHTSHNCC